MSISTSHKAFNAVIHTFENVLKTFSKDSYLKIATAIVNELDLVHTITTPKGTIRIKCLSETVRIRANGLLKREPDTLAWIETFNPDDVFWDVGSNIGVFTLYAAIIGKARVVAFDPLPNNYLGLTENLVLNDLTDRVQAFCIALSNVTKTAPLYISKEAITAGGANCPFGDDIDENGSPIQHGYTLAAMGFSIDGFLETFDVPFPNHLKIDIDKIQEDVILGARKTLRDPRLKTVMTELHRNNTAIGKKANEAGFTCRKTVGSTPSSAADREVSVTNNFFYRD